MRKRLERALHQSIEKDTIAMTQISMRALPGLCGRGLRLAALSTILGGSLICAAQAKPAAPPKPAPKPTPDVLVLSDGDILHGKFVSAVAGKVTFHTESLGDVALAWDKIKELHTAEPFAVLDSTVKLRGKKTAGAIPSGTLDVIGQAVIVHPETGPAPPPIAVKNAAYVVDQPTLNKQVYHQPSFFAGWNGAATAGATLVTATQNSYTFSGGIGLVRTVPTVSWLNARDRTSADFSGSFGRITQPAYTIPATSASAAVPMPAENIKSAITHVDAERDEYFSPRFFALGQTAFDHNYGQDLQLQQIYGGGIGWTAIKSPKLEVDFKATLQYEKQQFINNAGSAPGPSQNLVGSTFAASSILHLKLFTYTQGIGFIPAYNEPSAYSATETDAFAFPAYKNLSFSLGTLDSYLNDPPAGAEPPTKRNSFQFTMGFTYAIKSKY
ncbi:MAG: DUF481 domain-containing protein [Terracidiphilus sp.]